MRPSWVLPALAFALVAAQAAAQPLSDPTRPPAAAEEQKGERALGERPGLQSILISSGRKFAVIDGQTISIGQKFGDATLVAIRADEVVLRKAGRNEVLKLYPEVDKKHRDRTPAGKGPVKSARRAAASR